MYQKEVLIVGGDDSNHAGDKVGEVIVAIFSHNYEDSIVKRNLKFSRGYLEKTINWVNSDRRDYRFTLLTEDKYRHSSANLVYVVPKLISNYLEDTNENPEVLKIYLDGFLSSHGKIHIKKNFPGINRMVVDNFIKKRKENGKFSKKLECPLVVYHADILAHFLFKSTTSIENFLNHSKFVLVK
ncbi:MAG: hypothetical protein AABW81_00245 [Nanoarchaeota archaeon]